MEEIEVTYTSASVEALSTVTSVKQKGLVALNEAELIAQTFDLGRKEDLNLCGDPCSFKTDLGRGYHWGKR
jgi:hypothetical protein